MACGALVDEDIFGRKTVEGVTAWSLEVPMKNNPKFSACLRDSLEEVRLDRCTNVGIAKQVWRQARKTGALTIGCVCTACQLVLKDDFVFLFLARYNSHRGTGPKSPGSGIRCPFCVA